MDLYKNGIKVATVANFKRIPGKHHYDVDIGVRISTDPDIVTFTTDKVILPSIGSEYELRNGEVIKIQITSSAGRSVQATVEPEGWEP